MESISWPVSVQNEAGTPISGLTAADFLVFENGLEAPLLSVDESGAGGFEESRFFIVYLGEDLDFRDLFRARRALVSWSRSASGPRDRIAVFREGALSRFSTSKNEIRHLINFFGSTGDRFGFDPPRPEGRRPSWFRGLLDGAQEVTLLQQRTDEVVRSGSPGSLESALGRLKHLSGRKALIYLSRALPFSSNPSAREVAWLVRSLSDAGVSVFLPLSGEDSEDGSSSQLRRLAMATGGSVIASPSLKESLLQITSDVRRYYRLEVEASSVRDARYRKIEVRLRRPEGLRVRQPDGYFATVADSTDLPGRTFLTAIGRPDDFHDLPLEIDARVVLEAGPPQVEMRLSFPFRSLEASQSVAQEGFFQAIRVFAGVFSREGALLAYLDRGYTIRLESDQLPQADPTPLAFDGTLPINAGSRPHRVLIIVIAGQNRQISVKDLGLP